MFGKWIVYMHESIMQVPIFIYLLSSSSKKHSNKKQKHVMKLWLLLLPLRGEKNPLVSQDFYSFDRVM